MNKLGGKVKLSHGFSALRDAKTAKDTRALAAAYKALGNLAIAQATEHVDMQYALEDMKVCGCGSGHDEEAAVIRGLVDRLCQLSAKNDALEARILKLEEAGPPSDTSTRSPPSTRRERCN